MTYTYIQLTFHRLDIIRAFAGSERLCFSQDIRETVACASGQSFELVNGCPREVFLIIGSVLEKSKEHSMGWLSWDEYQIALVLAKHKLYSWNCQEKTYPSSDTRWEAVAQAFQFACILHILRLLDPLRPAHTPEIQDCVAKILDATASISAECSLLEILIFPLFMAGADALAPHSQYYVLSRFTEIMRRSEFRNPVPGDLLKKVWSARAEQDPDDERNIPWQRFVSTSIRDIQRAWLILSTRLISPNLHDSMTTSSYEPTPTDVAFDYNFNCVWRIIYIYIPQQCRRPT